MRQINYELCWEEIPVGKENAVGYEFLENLWGCTDREVRMILHDLSRFDNGDDYILIRSAGNKNGFYRTDDIETMKKYKKECLNKGRSIFAPVKKINRVLNENCNQIEFENNLRVAREAIGMKQCEVVKRMKKFDNHFDKAILSKMENSVCVPTPLQLSKLAEIYGCKASELISIYNNGD